MNRNGTSRLESVLADVLGQSVTLETQVLEYRAQFDTYRGPSNLDLGINGRTGGGSTLFIGVEAKMDEAFRVTVSARYRDARRRREKGKPTDGPERVEGLVSRYGPGNVQDALNRFGTIRYQLLTGTVGALAMGKDVSVFHVLVFKTRLYDEAKGYENHCDYEKFLRWVSGRPLPVTSARVLAHEIVLEDRPLTSIYQAIDQL